MSSSDVSSAPSPVMLPGPRPSLGGFMDTFQSTCGREVVPSGHATPIHHNKMPVEHSSLQLLPYLNL